MVLTSVCAETESVVWTSNVQSRRPAFLPEAEGDRLRAESSWAVRPVAEAREGEGATGDVGDNTHSIGDSPPAAAVTNLP